MSVRDVVPAAPPPTPLEIAKKKQEYNLRYRLKNLEACRERGREESRINYQENKYGQKYKWRTPRAKARKKLNEAIRYGKIVKPKNCSECNAIANAHGHHEDYEKPLDVIWLCSVCHGKRHRRY